MLFIRRRKNCCFAVKVWIKIFGFKMIGTSFYPLNLKFFIHVLSGFIKFKMSKVPLRLKRDQQLFVQLSCGFYLKVNKIILIRFV